MATPRILLLLLILRYSQPFPLIFETHGPAYQEFTYPLELNFKAEVLKFGGEKIIPCGPTPTAQCYTESASSMVDIFITKERQKNIKELRFFDEHGVNWTLPAHSVGLPSKEDYYKADIQCPIYPNYMLIVQQAPGGREQTKRVELYKAPMCYEDDDCFCVTAGHSSLKLRLKLKRDTATLYIEEKKSWDSMTATFHRCPGDAPPVDGSTTDPSGGGSATDPSGGGSATDPPGGGSATDPSGGDSATDPSGGDSATSPSGGDSATAWLPCSSNVIFANYLPYYATIISALLAQYPTA